MDRDWKKGRKRSKDGTGNEKKPFENAVICSYYELPQTNWF